MTIPQHSFTWQQGEDGNISMVYKEGDPAVPVDLTNYSVRMDVEHNDTILYSFNSDDFTGITDEVGEADNEAVLGVDGSINIIVPREVSITGDLSGVIGVALKYDVFLRNNTTNKQRKILRGTITIEESSTLWA